MWPQITIMAVVAVIGSAVLYAVGFKGFIPVFVIFMAVGAFLWQRGAAPLERDLSYLDPMLEFYRKTSPESVTDAELARLLQLPEGFSISQIRRIDLLCLFGQSGYIADSYKAGYVDDKGVPRAAELWRSEQKQMPLSRAKVVSVIKPWFLRMAKKRNIEIYENVGGAANMGGLFPTFVLNRPPAPRLRDALAAALQAGQGNGIKVIARADGITAIQVLVGADRMTSEIELGKDSLVVREEATSLAAAKSVLLASGEPPIAKTYSRSEILAIASTNYDISLSTSDAVPRKLLWVSSAPQRDALVDLFRAWLDNSS